MSTDSSASSESVFPSGLQNAFLFAAFNALSFQIVLGNPMILYAKSIGASATVVGVIAGMMPLLVIFQIPAASHVNRVGFRRFVLGGWAVRVLFIFSIAMVPLAGKFFDARNRLGLLLVLLFCFNLSRGISSCAWLPWITTLVPEDLRGKYLSRDAAVANVASFVALLISAAALIGQTRPWQFSIVFAFSATMGAVSLFFLKRIPDVPVPEEQRKSAGSVPWLEMALYPPFRKLLRSVVAWAVAYGGIMAFSVSFLKTYIGLPEGKVLLVTAVAFLGGASSLWFLGSRLDRLGSRPVLGFSCALWIVVLGGWILISGKAIAPGLAILILLQFFMGLLAALATMAQNRLAMAVIPVMGRNHFFAIFSVVSNVTLGLSPIAWGLLIDTIGDRNPLWMGIEWNRFSFFFAASALAFVVTAGLVRQLDEPKAVSMEELLREILIQSPQRFWLRFWPRG